MTTAWLAFAALLASAATARAAPKCQPARNKAVATRAVHAALADTKHPVRIAYEQFLDDNIDGIESRYSTIASGPNRREHYRKPVQNRWVQVIATGTSPGHEGEDKDSATEVCVDEYLAIASVPVEWKWHGERLYFAVAVSVTNGAKGTTTTLKPLKVTAIQP